jgi:hypothetical protein
LVTWHVRVDDLDPRFDQYYHDMLEVSVRGILWGLEGIGWGFVDAPDFVWRFPRSVSCQRAVDRRSFEEQTLLVLRPVLELCIRRISRSESVDE